MDPSEKISWNDSYSDMFLDSLRSKIIGNEDILLKEIDNDTEHAINNLVDIIIDSASCMKKPIRQNPKRNRSSWNLECRQAKRETRRALRKFRTQSTPANRTAYCRQRNHYKYCCRKFKSISNRRSVERLQRNMNNQSSFWKQIRSLQSKPEQKNRISKTEWLSHFKYVFYK